MRDGGSFRWKTTKLHKAGSYIGKAGLGNVIYKAILRGGVKKKVGEVDSGSDSATISLERQCVKHDLAVQTGSD